MSCRELKLNVSVKKQYYIKECLGLLREGDRSIRVLI